MKLLSAFVICFFFGSLTFAQIGKSETNNIWTGFSLERDLTDKLKLSFDHQFRFNKSQINTRSSFIEGGLKYKLSKHFYTRFQYRYIVRNDERNARRYAIDIGAKWKLKPIKGLNFKLRTRFQNTTVSYTGQNITYFRNRASLDYDIFKKWTTSFGYENFFRLNQKNEIRAHRYRWKISYDLSKRLEMNLFYQREHEVNKKTPENSSTIGFILVWELNKRKKNN